MLTCALLIATTAEPEDVDIACSIMLLVSTSYAAPSTIPMFRLIALFLVMPTSPLMMVSNMKAAMVPKIVGFDMRLDYQVVRLATVFQVPTRSPRALIVGEDNRAA
jgi:hypothetical protein